MDVLGHRRGVVFLRIDFFLLSPLEGRKIFLRKVFWVALAIRAVYAFVICYYYYYETGVAFEYDAGDSLWYHTTGVFLSRCIRQGYTSYIFPYLNAYTMGVICFGSRLFTLSSVAIC